MLGSGKADVLRNSDVIRCVRCEPSMVDSISEIVQLLKDGNHLEATRVVDLAERTIFEVPAPLRAQVPGSFQNKGL